MFGCIIAEGWYNEKCQMHDDPNACGYGTGIGIIAFLICLGFLILDALFENISSVQYRKYIVIADLSIAGKYNIVQSRWYAMCVCRTFFEFKANITKVSPTLYIVFNAFLVEFIMLSFSSWLDNGKDIFTQVHIVTSCTYIIHSLWQLHRTIGHDRCKLWRVPYMW